MIQNLKRLRDNAHISQEKLGDIVGVSQQSIYKYETSDVEPDIAILIKLANFFEVSVDYLIGHTDIRHRIERVTPYDLNDSEMVHMDMYRRLSPSSRSVVDSLISELLEK